MSTAAQLPSVVVIARGLATADLLAAVDALADAGVRALEVTLNSPGAFESIGALAGRHEDLLVGAGTVLDQADVARLADAGARFVLSPHVDERIIARTKACGMISVPGAFTPTEVHNARTAGADVVKIFPLHQAGPVHIRALREPLADIAMLACGGLTATAARECLSAGCVAVGVGLGLINADAVAARDWAALGRSASHYLDVLEAR